MFWIILQCDPCQPSYHACGLQCIHGYGQLTEWVMGNSLSKVLACCNDASCSDASSQCLGDAVTIALLNLVLRVPPQGE